MTEEIVDLNKLSKEDIDNFRKAMGTLPDRNTKKTYDYVNSLEVCHVALRDYPKNVMKNIVNAAASTWGTAEVGPTEGSCKKWEKLTPVNRYRVVLSALTGNTLPQACESINFFFEYNGIPRHTFDQWARTRLATHFSIGCRDNSKLSAPFVLYPDLYNEIQKDKKLKVQFEEWTRQTKDLYETILKSGSGSYQMARAVLPLSYNHSFTTSIDLSSLKQQLSRRLMACEEAPHVLMAWKMRNEIENKVSPFLANYFRPVCDTCQRCVYYEGPEGLTRFFSALFSNCGRWETEEKYSEFNHSCSDYSELSKYTRIVKRDEWVKFTFWDYDKLSLKDKLMFEEE